MLKCWPLYKLVVYFQKGHSPTSNKSVACPRQDSMSPCRAHVVLSGTCNIYMQVSLLREVIKAEIQPALHQHRETRESQHARTIIQWDTRSVPRLYMAHEMFPSLRSSPRLYYNTRRVSRLYHLHKKLSVCTTLKPWNKASIYRPAGSCQQMQHPP